MRYQSSLRALCAGVLTACASSLLLSSLGARSSAALAAARWWTIETPHFFIHFPDGEEFLGQKVAAAAERVHQWLVSALGLGPAEKTHVVLSDLGDQANGLADVLLYNRIIVLPAFPSPSLGYAAGLSGHAPDWIEMLLLHEYAHVLHLGMGDSYVQGLRSLFGHVPIAVTPNILEPPAMIEGFATFAETRFTTAGRGRDPYFDMFLRAAALAGKLPHLDQYLGAYDLDRWQPTGTIYLYGYSLLAYVAEAFGLDKMIDVHRRFSEAPATLGPAVTEALGISLRELDRRWRAWLVARYQREADALAAAGLTPVRALPTLGWLARDPAFSPDGRRIAYAASGGVFPALRVIGAEGRADRQLVAGALADGVAWTPDGRLVYAKAEHINPEQLVNDLYIYDPATRRETHLTRGKRAFNPAVSPDGRQVAFIARSGFLTSIWVMESDGQNARPLHADPNLQYLSLAYSPRGDRLAVTAWRPGGLTDIYTMAADGSNWTAVTQDRAVDQNPAWSPDGRYILFDSDRTGVYNLYAHDIGAGRFFRLSNTLTGLFRPAVSPDGESIAAMEYTADGYRLVTLAFDPAHWLPDPLTVPAERGGYPIPAAPQTSGVEPLAAHPVRPYEPADSLWPTFWLPVWGTAPAGTILGASTRGRDALGKVAYTLQAGVGVPSGPPAYMLATSLSLGPHGNLLLGASLSDQTKPAITSTGPLWRREQGFTGEIELPFLRAFSSLVLSGSFDWSRAGSFDDVLAGYPLTAADAAVGWEATAVSGRNRFQHQRRTGMTYRHAVDGADRWDARAERADTLHLSPAHAFDLAAALGWSDSDHPLGAGGTDGPFAVRGFPFGTIAGSRAARLTLSYTGRVARIERGFGDSPVFLRRLTLTPFADAAATRETDLAGATVAWRASAGVELGTHVNLLFGQAELDLRIGIALPVVEPGPPFLYVRLGGGTTPRALGPRKGR